MTKGIETMDARDASKPSDETGRRLRRLGLSALPIALVMCATAILFAASATPRAYGLLGGALLGLPGLGMLWLSIDLSTGLKLSRATERAKRRIAGANAEKRRLRCL
jgi:hypothetical protein